ncbi:MAG: PilZ domain-containing protein [Treponema sp.]|uniref:PilZ domain-containing protein n=1 Tax=Treponema sp. TaxID=166 RepID=UPI0025EF05E3|nr:PilZ domain-containing protein [Treponema sp.]MBQ9283108.1 PilZ domain-containing protein [Treponema sp.]
MFLVLFITALCLFILVRLLVVFQVPIQFFMMGQDKGFKFNEITLLWKLAKEAEIEEPMQLYVSVPTLNMAISKIILNSKENGTESLEATQNFIAKLYEYRTKIDLEHENKKGLDSTKYLEKGQRLRIILKGKGVFASEILSVGHEIIIRLPLQKNVRTVDSGDWVTKDVSVYLWRKGDAGYVFDTRVTNAGMFQGQNVIYLAHTNQLERAQKRKSVRAACEIYANLYFIDASEEPDYNVIEVDSGYKCLLEDISEDGAMIRIGGKGRQNVKIKIQFDIDERIIVMYGIIRAVEYNQIDNQSRLHFECLHIEKEMRNKILEFIYRDLSEDKKDELTALEEIEQENLDDSEIHDGEYGQEKDNEVVPESGNVPGQETSQPEIQTGA